jgi:hypothetical protein
MLDGTQNTHSAVVVQKVWLPCKIKKTSQLGNLINIIKRKIIHKARIIVSNYGNIIFTPEPKKIT